MKYSLNQAASLVLNPSDPTRVIFPLLDNPILSRRKEDRAMFLVDNQCVPEDFEEFLRSVPVLKKNSGIFITDFVLVTRCLTFCEDTVVEFSQTLRQQYDFFNEDVSLAVLVTNFHSSNDLSGIIQGALKECRIFPGEFQVP